MICVGDIVSVPENTPRIKLEIWTSRRINMRRGQKIRGACVLIKKTVSQGIIRGPVNKLNKIESSGSKATVQLKFIDENEIKNVTRAK